ncbi:MAG: NADH-quinone oxidoreductase subunit L [Planctomycetes bacterium]|nr:NADH-quinone oxidoreductase subunit L [Planctomycetota bacterium]
MDTALFVWLSASILLLPLVAFAILLFCGKKFERGADYLAIGVMGTAFILSVALFAKAAVWPATSDRPIVANLTWINLGNIKLTMGFLVDSLSSFMCMIVTGLATLVLIYSMFYLHGDTLYRRYFGFMCFFCFSMLGIVLSSSLLMTFVFWELVGLGSYFLIGFWFYKPPVSKDHHYQELKARYATGIDERFLSPAYAQRKAFVMNRIGDFGFVSGIMIFAYVMCKAAFSDPSFAQYAKGPLDYTNLYAATQAGVFNHITIWGLDGTALLTLAGILTFMGAMGKSAQFPLHTWLPDAMQGPTTGSSIIHAATMVAAGVYMTARIHPLLTEGSLFFVAVIGGVTAFLAATMAMVQWDIKAVLAYSTISQLGYMMIGLGAGAYTAGVAHLFTHAIFKCMLFLCAGSVIHACHHLQDMNRMGGLRRKMPLTFVATLAGVLAIIGCPFFSGFYSKDAILAGSCAKALEIGGLHWLPYLLGQATAALTAFYMCRLLFWTFFGKPRDKQVYDHAHESPPVATVPLMILALFCFGFWWSGTIVAHSGYLPGLTVQAEGVEAHGVEVETVRTTTGWVDALMVSPTHAAHLNEARIEGADAVRLHEERHEKAHTIATVLSLLGMLAGAGIAWLLYGAKSVDANELVAGNGLLALLWELVSQLWYFDRLYQDGIVPLFRAVNRVLYLFDFMVLDQILVDGWAYFIMAVSQVGRAFDNWVVDKCVDLFGTVTALCGQLTRSLQAGKIQYYACVTFGAVALVLLMLLMMQ